MTFLGAPLGALGGAFAVAGVAIVALYVLKIRRRRLEVPFADLWQRLLRETEATALWRRLKKLVSLAVQLVLLTLILGAIGDPRLAASARGRSIVLLVDTSASMQATDGQPTRLDDAKEAARRVVKAMGAEDEALLLALDGRPAPVTGFESDDRGLLRAIDGLSASDTPADVERALRLAGDALRGRARPTLVWIGDGAYDDSVLARARLDAPPGAKALGAIDLAGVDARFAPVGSSGDNLGITAFAVRRYRANQTAYEVLVEVQSFADQPKVAKLELVQDGEVVNVERLEVAAGEKLLRLYPNLAGEGTRLEARLKPDGDAQVALDRFPLDDHAYALLPPRRKLRVELVTAGNLFLEGALLLDQNLDTIKIAPAAWDATASARFDAVILDGFTPEEPPRTHALYLDPDGAASPFRVRGVMAVPLVTETAVDHPLLRWVTLKDLNIARARELALEPGDVAVASALKRPIVAARDRDGRKTVALGFDLKRSDLPMRVAFPVLVVNALEWFSGGDGALIATWPTGRPFRLPAPPGATDLEVRGPDGRTVRAPVHDGHASFYGGHVGYYEARPLGAANVAFDPAPRLFAANLASAQESKILPRAELRLGGRVLAAPEPGRVGVRRSLWGYLIVLALGLVLVEWWTYNRRFTV